MSPLLTGVLSDLISFVKDRPGHDTRYARSCRRNSKRTWILMAKVIQ